MVFHGMQPIPDRQIPRLFLTLFLADIVHPGCFMVALVPGGPSVTCGIIVLEIHRRRWPVVSLPMPSQENSHKGSRIHFSISAKQALLSPSPMRGGGLAYSLLTS